MSETKKANQPENQSALAQFATKHAKTLVEISEVALPLLIKFSRKAHATYMKLPKDHLALLFGFIICFFGGVYPVLFAAIEAARHGGLSEVTKALNELSNEIMVILQASAKDDEVDEDNDGVADVDEITSSQYVSRKTKLVLRKINPEKVNSALKTIYRVWFSVVVVLTVQMAKTVAFAHSISDFVRKPCNRYVVPSILAVTPKEYHRWIPVLVEWATRSIGVWVAFYLKSVKTAVTSSLTGALLITRALMNLAVKNDWDFGGMLAKNHEETMFDEYASYVIAFLGFRFQWNMGFSTPFPLNVILFPLETGEYMLRWYLVKR